MPIVLQGDPFNLQGSSGASLQPAGNPQNAYRPVPPTTAAPVATVPRPVPKPVTQPVAKPAVPKLDTTGLISASLSPYIGARPSPYNPSVADFFRKDTGQDLDQTGLFSYASSLGFGNISSFDQIKSFTPQLQTSTPLSAPASMPFNSQPDPNQALAQQAARAGLSLDDYLKLSSPSVTPEEKQSIYDKLGINQLEQSVFTPPSKTTEQTYQDAYNQAGLSDLKAKIADLDSRINALKQKYTDKQGTINENPFLSEASRTGRLKILTDQGNAEIGNLIDEYNQYSNLYTNGVNEVNNLVTRSTTDFNANQTLNAQKLQYLQGKAEGQIADLTASKTKEAYQYLPDYLKAKAGATKPDVIGSAESGYYRWNADTGTFEQVIAPSVTPNYQANPLTGDLFNTKNGQTLGGGATGGGGFPSGAQTSGSAAAVNNPLGIKPNGAFAKYETPDQGFQAGVQLVQRYQTNGPAGMNAQSTLNQMVNTWITGNPNNTSKTGYNANNVAQYLQQLGVQGVTANTPIGQIDSTALAAAIAHFETGYKTGSSLGSDTIGTLAQGVINNPQTYSNLTSQQQAAVNARLAQAGIPLPTNTKPASDTQNQAATYATRVQQAGNLIDSIQNKIASMNPLSFEAQSHLPSHLQSGDFQAYDQAARNLVNSILRRESGAAISTGEFNNAYMQYLPRAGDTAQTLTQKKQNRDAILNGLVQSAGSAYKGTSGGSTDLSDLNFSF